MGIIESSFKEAIDAAAGGTRDAFVTLEDVQDSEKWVQLTWDCINAAYPSQQHPNALLAKHRISLPQHVELASWEAGKYVTYTHRAEPLEPLVQFVEAYITKVLGAIPSDNALKATRE